MPNGDKNKPNEKLISDIYSYLKSDPGVKMSSDYNTFRNERITSTSGFNKLHAHLSKTLLSPAGDIGTPDQFRATLFGEPETQPIGEKPVEKPKEEIPTGEPVERDVTELIPVEPSLTDMEQQRIASEQGPKVTEPIADGEFIAPQYIPERVSTATDIEISAEMAGEQKSVEWKNLNAYDKHINTANMSVAGQQLEQERMLEGKPPPTEWEKSQAYIYGQKPSQSVEWLDDESLKLLHKLQRDKKSVEKITGGVPDEFLKKEKELKSNYFKTVSNRIFEIQEQLGSGMIKKRITSASEIIGAGAGLVMGGPGGAIIGREAGKDADVLPITRERAITPEEKRELEDELVSLEGIKNNYLSVTPERALMIAINNNKDDIARTAVQFQDKFPKDATPKEIFDTYYNILSTRANDLRAGLSEDGEPYNRNRVSNFLSWLPIVGEDMISPQERELYDLEKQLKSLAPVYFTNLSPFTNPEEQNTLEVFGKKLVTNLFPATKKSLLDEVETAILLKKTINELGIKPEETNKAIDELVEKKTDESFANMTARFIGEVSSVMPGLMIMGGVVGAGAKVTGLSKVMMRLAQSPNKVHKFTSFLIRGGMEELKFAGAFPEHKPLTGFAFQGGIEGVGNLSKMLGRKYGVVLQPLLKTFLEKSVGGSLGVTAAMEISAGAGELSDMIFKGKDELMAAEQMGWAKNQYDELGNVVGTEWTIGDKGKELLSMFIGNMILGFAHIQKGEIKEKKAELNELSDIMKDKGFEADAEYMKNVSDNLEDIIETNLKVYEMANKNSEKRKEERVELPMEVVEKPPEKPAVEEKKPVVEKPLEVEKKPPVEEIKPIEKEPVKVEEKPVEPKPIEKPKEELPPVKEPVDYDPTSKEKARQFVIDMIEEGMVPTKEVKPPKKPGEERIIRVPIEERLNLSGMRNKEVVKAKKDILEGNIETAPAKMLIKRLEEFYERGDVEFYAAGRESVRISMEEILSFMEESKKIEKTIPDNLGKILEEGEFDIEGMKDINEIEELIESQKKKIPEKDYNEYIKFIENERKQIELQKEIIEEAPGTKEGVVEKPEAITEKPAKEPTAKPEVIIEEGPAGMAERAIKEASENIKKGIPPVRTKIDGKVVGEYLLEQKEAGNITEAEFKKLQKEYSDVVSEFKKVSKEEEEKIIKEAGRGENLAVTKEFNKETEDPERMQSIIGISIDDAFITDMAKKTKDFFKKYFRSSGFLPDNVFQEKIKMEGATHAIIRDIKFTARDFRKAIKKVYGTRPSKSNITNIDKALKGELPINELPEGVKDVVSEMRNQIDVLSGRLISEGLVGGELKNVVQGNLGTYMTRSYKVYDDPAGWKKFVEKNPDGQRIRNDAMTFLRNEYKEIGEEKTENEMHGIINEILYKEDAPLNMLSKLGSKDLSILKRRGEIAPEIRALLGEYNDPLLNYARSITKMANLVEKSRFLEKVKEIGFDKFLFKNPNEKHYVKISSEGSKTIEPLNGLYTTPEIKEAFEGMDVVSSSSWAFKQYMKINGFVKFSKTVLSVMTHIRNMIGNLGFVVANSHTKLGKFDTAIKTTINDLGNLDMEGFRERYKHYLKLGVVAESTRAGELRDVIKDATGKESDFEKIFDSRIKRVVKKGFKIVTSLYQAEDDVFKIYAFENELARYKKAFPDMEKGEVESISANIVRNTYPTYTLVPKIVKELRKAPLVGTFVSFPAEVIRTSWNTVGIAIKEIKNPATRNIGIKRASGMLVAAIGTGALATTSRSIYGITKDEDDDFRRFVAPWTKNSQIIYMSYPKDGKYVYVDLGYSDPHNYLKNPINALMGEGDILNNAIDAVKEFAEPLVGPEILASRLADVYANKKPSGQPIYNEQLPIGDQAAAIYKYVIDALEPGTVSSFNRIWKGIHGKENEYGRTYDPAVEITAVFSGQRVATLDVGQSFSFKSFRFKQNIAEAKRIYTKVKNRKGAVSAGELEDAYNKSNVALEKLYTGMYQDYRSALRLGVDEEELSKIINRNKFSRKTKRMIKSGEYIPLQKDSGKQSGIKFQ